MRSPPGVVVALASARMSPVMRLVPTGIHATEDGSDSSGCSLLTVIY